MKTLTKLDLKHMEKELQVINLEEQNSIIGGSGYGVGESYNIIQISGGYLYEAGGDTYFRTYDGRECCFQGVKFSTQNVASDTAYQLNGTIHISQSWIDSGFSINTFAHEYGHYLQQKDMGFWAYMGYVALPSAYSAATDPNNHSSQSFEQDATNRGNEYMNSHWK